MLTVTTVAGALGVMAAGIVLLGLWPTLWEAVERQHRNPAHTFVDYALSYMLFAALASSTLGQLGPPAVHAPTGASLQFFDQLSHLASIWQCLLFALGGGVCLALGDLALQYSITLCGLAVGPPLLNAVTLIVSVVLAYLLDGGVNKPALVFPGAAAATAAIGLGAAAHVVNDRQRRQERQRQQGQQQQSGSCIVHAGYCDDSAHRGAGRQAGSRQQQSGDMAEEGMCSSTCPTCKHAGGVAVGDCLADSSCSSSPVSAAAAAAAAAAATAGRHHAALAAPSGCGGCCCGGGGGSCGCHPHHSPPEEDASGNCKCVSSSSSSSCSSSQQQQQQQQPPHPPDRSDGWRHTAAGLTVAALGGLIYGCFIPAFQIAANDPLRMLPAGAAPLSLYTTLFFFAAAFCATSLAANALLLYRPPLRAQASSLTAYLNDGGTGRALAVGSGLLAASGDLCQFMGGQAVGYAAAMMVAAYPVIGVLWGLLRPCCTGGRRPQAAQAGSKSVVRGGCSPGLALVAAQMVAYLLSVGLLAGSAEVRSGTGSHGVHALL